MCTFDTTLVTHGNETAVGFSENPTPLFEFSDLVVCARQVDLCGEPHIPVPVSSCAQCRVESNDGFPGLVQEEPAGAFVNKKPTRIPVTEKPSTVNFINVVNSAPCARQSVLALPIKLEHRICLGKLGAYSCPGGRRQAICHRCSVSEYPQTNDYVAVRADQRRRIRPQVAFEYSSHPSDDRITHAVCQLASKCAVRERHRTIADSTPYSTCDNGGLTQQ